jgi:hypothetical protein
MPSSPPYRTSCARRCRPSWRGRSSSGIGASVPGRSSVGSPPSSAMPTPRRSSSRTCSTSPASCPASCGSS